ncbi:HlyD family secretion protein [Methylocapsa palsarum]|uniref:Membrane fusion protein, multidrug efflux system n=1 Tax=Methylocapsa palsarum TaxID=1612308 RepID=A0A1I3W229_9HYPH|nr:HlyD family secretion protein [Methylocapsa palsarum]SFK01535.1 membrane fusion protein, multidrug efflux system [Methylocapsa palsarum]
MNQPSENPIPREYSEEMFEEGEDAHRPQEKEAGEEHPRSEEAPKGDEQSPKTKRALLRAGGVVAAALIGGGLYLYLSTRNIQSTDDAFVDGRAITIAPQISGLVTSLDVTDNQFVRKGDPLIQIDPRQYLQDRDSAEGALKIAKAQLTGQKLGAEIARKNFPAQLQQAKARLLSAQAAEVKAQADYQRQRSLPKQATTQQEVDAATAGLRQAQAQVALAEAQVLEAEPAPQRIGQADEQVGQLSGQVEQAQAKLEQANLNLSWTIVRAPQDGWITKRNVEVGNYVTPGQQIFSIVSPEVWVTANFKETQLDRMRPGQDVDITLDAYPHLRLKGHVDSVQLGSGSKFTAFPPENATGNFVKIVQRIPVKIAIDSGLDPNLPVPLGASAVPTVKLQ